jgi:hypothetical protein
MFPATLSGSSGNDADEPMSAAGRSASAFALPPDIHIPPNHTTSFTDHLDCARRSTTTAAWRRRRPDRLSGTICHTGPTYHGHQRSITGCPHRLRIGLHPADSSDRHAMGWDGMANPIYADKWTARLIEFGRFNHHVERRFSTSGGRRQSDDLLASGLRMHASCQPIDVACGRRLSAGGTVARLLPTARCGCSAITRAIRHGDTCGGTAPPITTASRAGDPQSRQRRIGVMPTSALRRLCRPGGYADVGIGSRAR